MIITVLSILNAAASHSGQIIIDDSGNDHYIVNGNSLATDIEDGVLTNRGAYIEDGQGLYLAPPEISQFGFTLPETFTLIIWIYPIATHSQTLLKKGSFLEIHLEPTLSQIQATYNGQAGPVVSTDAVGKYYSGKWGLLSISHNTDSDTQTLKLFYNDTPGTTTTFELTFSDTSSQQFVLGSSLVTSPFRGFIFKLIIYSKIIPDADYYDSSLFRVGTGGCIYPSFFSICISTETDPLKNSDGIACSSCPNSCISEITCIECDPSCNDFCSFPNDSNACFDMIAECLPGSFDSTYPRCEWPCTTHCVTCTYSNECTSCDSGYDLQPDLSCSVGCPSGYTSVSQVCTPCSSRCSECVGTTSSDCTVCSDANSSLSSLPGSCSCNPGFYSSDSETLLCFACDSSCSECSGPSQNECLSCADSLRAITKGSCVCIEGYFDATTSCDQCHSDCASCDGPEAKDCLSCSDSLKDVQEEDCVCKEGYYLDEDNNCAACHGDCQTCDGLLETQCTSCIDPTNTLDNGSCKCEGGFYKDSEGSCQVCNLECSSCEASASNCLECSNPDTSLENGCVCEEGYFSEGTCKPCPSGCASCTNAEECSECSNSNEEIIQGRCECKEGYCEDEEQCTDCKAIPFETELTTEGMVGAGSLGGSLILGLVSMLTVEDPTVIWSITNIAQVICYLAVLDLPLSGPFYQFLISYQTVSLLPNYFLDIHADSNVPVEYQKFGYLKKEYRDSNFLKNSGRYIELILIVASAHLTMYLISLILPQNLKTRVRKVTSCWISSVLRIVFMVFLDLCVAVSIGIFVKSSQNDALSEQLCIIVSALLLSTPFVLMMVANLKERIKSKDTSVTKYIGSLYSKLNLESGCSYYYEMILSIRRLTYAITLFFYRKDPLVFLIIQCCFSVFLAVYTISGRIYETRTKLVTSFLSEILLLLTFVGLIVILFKGEYREIETIIMGTNIFFILVASIVNLIALVIKKCREKKNKRENPTPVVKINPYMNDELFSASGRDIIPSSRIDDDRLNCRNILANSSNASVDITGISPEMLIINRKRIANNVIYIDNAD